MSSDFTLQLNFKKLPLVKFWCIIKEENPQLPLFYFLFQSFLDFLHKF